MLFRKKDNNLGRYLGWLQCTSVAHSGPLQPRRWQTICLWHWAGVISVLICLNWIFYLILNLSITVAFQSEGTFPDSFHTGRSPRPARRSAPLAHLPVLFEKLPFWSTTVGNTCQHTQYLPTHTYLLCPLSPSWDSTPELMIRRSHVYNTDLNFLSTCC